MTDFTEKEEKLKKQIHNMENEMKVLMREQKDLNRKDRAHRLIVRGAILEKHLKKPNVLTDEDISGLMEYAFLLEPVDTRLNRLISDREDQIKKPDPGNEAA